VNIEYDYSRDNEPHLKSHCYGQLGTLNSRAETQLKRNQNAIKAQANVPQQGKGYNETQAQPLTSTQARKRANCPA
jgi:hypothetical protein